CKQPIDPGLCLAYFPKWGFDQGTGTCTEFIYGGCGGNENRFDDERSCQHACHRLRGRWN
uniref:BPTI/Kunitz inhibitor domain-containing protein n=1 Tax=Mesocestoides corti TaxID=53468 RepID=A0A5K3FWP5_MESCO